MPSIKSFSKDNKARLKYIEAQLYQELGMKAEASEAYRAVTKMNPDYKMAFNAKINSAGIFSGEGNAEDLKKELNKMLRDNKNFDFRDQIYYALGNLYFKEGNREVAIDNYTKSVATSFQNQFQRALSSITVADIYFEDLEYRKAQSYYDSAMIIIDENYPDYETVSTKYKGLTNLVDNLITVEREDSLQKIARMPEIERESLIARIMKEEQERQRNEENLAMQGMGKSGLQPFEPKPTGNGKPASGSRMVFLQSANCFIRAGYLSSNCGENENSKTTGTVPTKEFQLKFRKRAWKEWIPRRLLSGKQDPLKKEFYTQDLPLTDSLMAISHDKIRDALFNAGKIFKVDFTNYPRSADSFEDLNRRYPDNIYLLSAMFELYDLYELMGDKQKSDYYRNLIISQFPKSNYAQYLVNPNFFVEMQARLDNLNKLVPGNF